MKQIKKKLSPRRIFAEYEAGRQYKESIGERGLYEQSKLNERFFVGDQWYGAQCGNSRPLARRNVIKRIGEYKMAAIGAAPAAVNYSAEGIPDNADMKSRRSAALERLRAGIFPEGETDEAEISVITAAMSDYFRVTAERLKFDSKKDQLLRNAYISGTAVAYTYWDDTVETGLYADAAKTAPIKGDIAMEILDIENVIFGDPNCDEVQKQPYIIIAQRRGAAEVRREAKRWGASEREIEEIAPDAAYNFNSGDRGDSEPADSERVTVLTKLFKEYSPDGSGFTVKAVRVTENAVVRPEWDLKLRLYPLAKFCWERRRSCAYGDSEITYLIPNQIAINRALTAEIWALMAAGMPKMIINGDSVTENVTNDPGQIIKIYGTAEDVAGAIRYVSPPVFSPQLSSVIDSLASYTMTDSGANDAALGDIRPDNAAAIIQLREAAMAPMQMYQNRFYDFIEDIARIWADFWINLYGDRWLRAEDKNGVHYLPFSAERYKRLVITARIDVGASTVWSESVTVATLGNLLEAGLITFEQYLERIPKGMIPDASGLLADLEAQRAGAQGGSAFPAGTAGMEDSAGSLPESYAAGVFGGSSDPTGGYADLAAGSGGAYEPPAENYGTEDYSEPAAALNGAQDGTAVQNTDFEYILKGLKEGYPELYSRLMSLPEAERDALITQLLAGGGKGAAGL